MKCFPDLHTLSTGADWVTLDVTTAGGRLLILGWFTSATPRKDGPDCVAATLWTLSHT